MSQRVSCRVASVWWYRPVMRATLLMIAIHVSACTQVQFPADSPNVRITRAAFAREYSRTTKLRVVTFELDPRGISGTALMQNFLDEAQQLGARYVSDLAIALQFRVNGAATECVTQVTVETGEPVPAPPAQPPVAADPDEYSTEVTPWRPPVIDTWVTDAELVCTKQLAWAVNRRPRYASRHDVEVGEYIEPGAMPHDRVIETTPVEQCHVEPRRRFAHRYEHFVAARFVPVDWERIAKRYTDWRLTEQPPVCHQLRDAKPNTKLIHRISGHLHFIGSLGRTSQPEILTK